MRPGRRSPTIATAAAGATSSMTTSGLPSSAGTRTYVSVMTLPPSSSRAATIAMLIADDPPCATGQP